IGNALELTANSVLNVKTTDEVSDKSPLPLTSKGAAALEEKIRQDFPSAINDALIQAMENGEFKGENGRSAYEYALDGGFVGSEVDFAKSLAGNDDVLPDYWEEHLKEKISAINALHDTGGKECFSFIVISDIHYEQNLGKKAPLIAKKISDECGIKYVLILGDCGTRNGILYGLDYIDNEWKEIEKMLSPIRDRLLITDGNHDGSYGATDGDGDGVIDGVHGSGNSAFNFTPQKKYNKIKRKVSLIDGVTFDENGCGYYVDDKNSKIRYIVLSTHNNKYVENGDGSSKYSNMNNFRFGQSQFDLVIKALSSLEDGWSVLVASHVPLDRSGELLHWGGTAMNGDNYLTEGEVECWIMADVLNAFVNKTTYNGSFIGTQGDTQAYKNLADRTSSDWLSGYRTSNSGVTQEEGFETTNFLGDGETCVGNMTIYYKNATMSNQRLLFYNADKELVYNTYPTTFTVHTGFDGSATEGQLFIDIDRNEALGSAVYVRLCLNSGDTEPIITLNEPIVSSDNTYDAVSVDVDFTNANGTLIGYFGGHVHNDSAWGTTYDWDGRLKRCDFWTITTRCDSKNEND
ncbi:MAG: metallophosphoesterase, partial [Clostridia bacterium]|nr:metallophosphoesterase [Clostridia bacterium]